MIMAMAMGNLKKRLYLSSRNSGGVMAGRVLIFLTKKAMMKRIGILGATNPHIDPNPSRI